MPPAVRSQLSALEDDQKRRATRSLRDGIDRVLTDLQSMFRDVVMLQFGRGTGDGDSSTANSSRSCAPSPPRGRRSARSPSSISIAETRRNLEQNVAPTLALESMLVTVASGRTP